MEKYLTIGEMATLFHINTSQLRYYEKEGLLNSFKDPENGYRFYGFVQMERLEIILLLREIGTPVAEIKQYFLEKDTDAYHGLLSRSITRIDKEIKNLTQKRALLIRRQEALLHTHFDSISPEEKPTRILYLIDETQVNLSQPKSLYLYIQKHHYDYLDYSKIPYGIFSSPDCKTPKVGIYDAFDTGVLSNLQAMTLPSGWYLTLTTFISKEEEIAQTFDTLLQYAQKNGYKVIAPFFQYTDINRFGLDANKLLVTCEVGVSLPITPL